MEETNGKKKPPVVVRIVNNTLQFEQVEVHRLFVENSAFNITEALYVKDQLYMDGLQVPEPLDLSVITCEGMIDIVDTPIKSVPKGGWIFLYLKNTGIETVELSHIRRSSRSEYDVVTVIDDKSITIRAVREERVIVEGGMCFKHLSLERYNLPQKKTVTFQGSFLVRGFLSLDEGTTLKIAEGSLLEVTEGMWHNSPIERFRPFILPGGTILDL